MSAQIIRLNSLMSAAINASAKKSKTAKQANPAQQVMHVDISKADGKPVVFDGHYRIQAMLDLGMIVIGNCEDGTSYTIVNSEPEVIGTCTNEDGAMKVNLANETPFSFHEITKNDNV